MINPNPLNFKTCPDCGNYVCSLEANGKCAECNAGPEEEELECVEKSRDCRGVVLYRESPSGRNITRCEYHNDRRWAIHYHKPVRLPSYYSAS